MEYIFKGAQGGPFNKSVSTPRRLRLQNFRTRKEVGKSHHFHHVLADHLFEYFYAALLLLLGLHQIRKLHRSLHVHVPDFDPRSLGGGYG